MQNTFIEVTVDLVISNVSTFLWTKSWLSLILSLVVSWDLPRHYKTKTCTSTKAFIWPKCIIFNNGAAYTSTNCKNDNLFQREKIYFTCCTYQTNLMLFIFSISSFVRMLYVLYTQGCATMECVIIHSLTVYYYAKPNSEILI